MNKKVQETQTIKIRITTHNQLKVLAALRKQNMMDTLDHLIQQDLARIKREEAK